MKKILGYLLFTISVAYIILILALCNDYSLTTVEVLQYIGLGVLGLIPLGISFHLIGDLR